MAHAGSEQPQERTVDVATYRGRHEPGDEAALRRREQEILRAKEQRKAAAKQQRDDAAKVAQAVRERAQTLRDQQKRK